MKWVILFLIVVLSACSSVQTQDATLQINQEVQVTKINMDNTQEQSSFTGLYNLPPHEYGGNTDMRDEYDKANGNFGLVRIGQITWGKFAKNEIQLNSIENATKYFMLTLMGVQYKPSDVPQIIDNCAVGTTYCASAGEQCGGFYLCRKNNVLIQIFYSTQPYNVVPEEVKEEMKSAKEQLELYRQ